MGLIVTYCWHIRRYIRVTSNIPAICRGFSFPVLVLPLSRSTFGNRVSSDHVAQQKGWCILV